MARRQVWLRDELVEAGADPLPCVGCCAPGSTSAGAAAAMRGHLHLELGWAARQRSWPDALLRCLRGCAEADGMLVVFNGVVSSNTHRKLDRHELQGFALIDRYAPLIFGNGADFKAARMFALAHELRMCSLVPQACRTWMRRRLRAMARSGSATLPQRNSWCPKRS